MIIATTLMSPDELRGAPAMSVSPVESCEADDALVVVMTGSSPLNRMPAMPAG